MTIVHVTPYLAPAWAHGPVPAVVWSLARVQAAAGCNVSVLTTDAMAPHERQPAGEFSADGVRIVRVRNVSGLVESWLQVSTPRGFRARARELFKRTPPDVVHLHELRTIENALIVSLVPKEAQLVASTHGTERVSSRRDSLLWRRLALAPVLRRLDHLVVADAGEAASATTLWASLAPGRTTPVTIQPASVDEAEFLRTCVYRP